MPYFGIIEYMASTNEILELNKASNMKAQHKMKMLTNEILTKNVHVGKRYL